MNNNDSYENALEIIRRGQRCHSVIVGPTGPTERLFKSSNKIIIDSS